MFKLCVCPEKKVRNINNLIVAIRKVKRIERKLLERYSRGKSVFYSIQNKNACLAASDLFHIFTQSIKFYTLSRIKGTDV